VSTTSSTVTDPAPLAPRATSTLASRHGVLTLALLCAVAFLDFIDASIVNVALPSIRDDLGFTVQGLQWVLSGYLLTYGGFMLLGGRAGDLLGRRRVLVAGTAVFGLSSLAGGLATEPWMLVGARLAQGVGAAMMLPAALSLLTTTFRDGQDRNRALGVWGGVAGLASAAGVLLGGLLTDGPGWRWVLFVNPPICVLLLAAIFGIIPRDVRRPKFAGFDLIGSVLVTAGMLLLVFALIKAPSQGWGSVRTIAELAGAAALLLAFLANERRSRNPLVPLSIFRIRGLAAADVTQLVAVAGVLAMFFFLTLYMQLVLGWSPMKTGLAYLPLCAGVAVAAGVTGQLIRPVGTKPLVVVGALIAAAGLATLSRVPVHGDYVHDLLPGLLIVSIGLGAVFVANTTAANAGVPADKAGLAAALVNASQQVGAALGLAILSAVATARIADLLAAHANPADALTGGIHRALLVGSVFVLATAGVALGTTNTRGETEDTDDEPETEEAVALAG
jgi:EmrB/QacA subfamily drug resistance transporter